MNLYSQFTVYVKKCVPLLLSLTFLPVVNAQQTVTLSPVKDNTLYEDNSGALSNGAGSYLFSGKTNDNLIRRALLQFDVAALIPAGSVIESVELTLNVSKSATSNQEIAVHRVINDWGEGASNASSNEGQGASSMTGDATWIHTFMATGTWTAPGGDFQSTASATASVGSTGPVTWVSTQNLVSDVQHWVDHPAENFGWLLKGNESSIKTAKRFDAKEHPTPSNRPALHVTYSPSTAVANEGVPPLSLALHPVYPNPFNPQTKITYTVDKRQAVRLVVYDLLGRVVCHLGGDVKSPGQHHALWDGMDDSGRGLPSGTYLISLITADCRLVRKVVMSR